MLYLLIFIALFILFFIIDTYSYILYSLRTNVSVRYKPSQIATAAIFMAARKLQIKLPGPPFPWWELFECTVDDIF